MDENKIPDPQRMTRQECIRYLDINEETFDNWVEGKCPKILEEGMKKPLFNLGAVVKWRVDKEKKKNKVVKTDSAEGEKTVGDIEFALREKIMRQDLRKKTIDNDEKEGILVDKKQMEDRYFRLGRALRDNLISKDSVWGPQLSMVSGFEASVYLRKEFEKFCNSIADLNLLDDHTLAIELNDYFNMGMNYRWVDVKVIDDQKLIGENK